MLSFFIDAGENLNGLNNVLDISIIVYSASVYDFDIYFSHQI